MDWSIWDRLAGSYAPFRNLCKETIVNLRSTQLQCGDAKLSHPWACPVTAEQIGGAGLLNSTLNSQSFRLCADRGPHRVATPRSH